MSKIDKTEIEKQIEELDKEIEELAEYLNSDIKCNSYWDMCYEYLNELEQTKCELIKNKESGL